MDTPFLDATALMSWFATCTDFLFTSMEGKLGRVTLGCSACACACGPGACAGPGAEGNTGSHWIERVNLSTATVFKGLLEETTEEGLWTASRTLTLVQQNEQNRVFFMGKWRCR